MNSNLPDTKDREEEKADDYFELLKKYKQIENDMKAFNDGLANQFRKQQERTSRFEIDNYKYLEDLRILDNDANMQKKEENTA